MQQNENEQCLKRQKRLEKVDGEAGLGLAVSNPFLLLSQNWNCNSGRKVSARACRVNQDNPHFLTLPAALIVIFDSILNPFRKLSRSKSNYNFGGQFSN